MRALKHSAALFLACSLFAGDSNTITKLDDYISSYKQKEFELDYKKNEAESLKLRDSWVSPLQLRYSYRKSDPYGNTQVTKNSSISLNQSIFRSGGIYYGIKFASASKKYSDYSITMQKRRLIKDAISLLMQIKRSELQLQKQKKQIKNSTIKLEQNRQEYLSGNLESGFLDNAIIQLNLVKQVKLDLETSKEKLVSKFKALSDIDYKTAFIPHLKNVSKEEFLAHNIALKYFDSQREKNLYAKNVTIAKYLPALNITASYNRDEVDNPTFAGTGVPSPPPTNYYSYGFSINMPLDWNTFRDVESSKIDYLKSNILIEDKKRELLSLYEQIEQNLNNIKRKIMLAKENYAIYMKLLDDTKKLYKAGYKAKMDVDLLQNSADMAKLDMQIFEIDKQLELLGLYEYYTPGEKSAL